MPFLTLDDLNPQSFRAAHVINEQHNVRVSHRGKRVFLSYRRKDKRLVMPIVSLLISLGTEVYIDYLDERLPDKPSLATASILRNKIKLSGRFILLATPNSSESLWIPWELGLGDGFIDYKNVAILPITSNCKAWDEQEYFDIYGYIKYHQPIGLNKRWVISFPDGNNQLLSEWLDI